MLILLVGADEDKELLLSLNGPLKLKLPVLLLVSLSWSPRGFRLSIDARLRAVIGGDIRGFIGGEADACS